MEELDQIAIGRSNGALGSALFIAGIDGALRGAGFRICGSRKLRPAQSVH